MRTLTLLMPSHTRNFDGNKLGRVYKFHAIKTSTDSVKFTMLTNAKFSLLIVQHRMAFLLHFDSARRYLRLGLGMATFITDVV